MQPTRSWRPAFLPGAILVTVSAAACGGEQVATDAGASPPFTPVVSVEGLMHDLIYPNAEVLWESVGTIITAEGTQEIRPRSHEEWEAVIQSAVTLAEAGNLLMLEGRAKNSGEWMDLAGALTEAATKALEAADNRDPEDLFDKGGEVYYACNNCHELYWEKPPSAMRP